MKVKSKILITVVIILVGVSISVTLAVGGLLSAPNLVKIGEIPAELKGKNVKFNSNTGKSLSGWLIPGKSERGGILLMHGVRSNRKQMIDRAIFLNETGYTILLFDFQAHGESPGKNITFGYLEAKDAEAAFTYLEAQLETKIIGVIGVSLGGASAILSNISSRARALVLEAVYPTLREAVQNRMYIRLGVLGRYLSPLLLWQIEPRLGFNPDQLSPIGSLSKLNIPLLMIAGSDDEHTTLAESKRMYSTVQGSKELWVVKGARHQDFLKYSPVTYKDVVLKFFNRYL